MQQRGRRLAAPLGGGTAAWGVAVPRGWPTGQEAEWEGSPPCALLRLGTWGPRPCGLWTLWLYPQQGVSAYRPAPIQDTPTPRGLAAHAECRGPRWPRRSRPRGPAPSTWPASAAAPGPARPGAGRPCAVRGTRHAAAAPPPAPGWRAAGGPSLHGTAARARHTLPPTPLRHKSGAGEGFWVHPAVHWQAQEELPGVDGQAGEKPPRTCASAGGMALSPPAPRLTQLPALLRLLRQ